MPSGIGFFESIVISIFCFLYLLFNTDVFPNVIPVLIEKKQREQSAYPAVSVIKRMDAKEVADKCRNKYQASIFSFAIART